MFSHAVVATDLGPSSEGIVACAGALRSLGVKEALLIHAIDLSEEPSPAEDALFQRQIDDLEEAGVRVHVETPLGYAPHAITKLAVEYDAGVIVMGTRGQGLFHTGFSGSVSSDVVRLSPVPVLLIPQPAGGTTEPGDSACARLLASILVPVDLASAAERVCELACSLARTGAGRLEILHAVEMSFEAVREGREARARELLGEGEEIVPGPQAADHLDGGVAVVGRGDQDGVDDDDQEDRLHHADSRLAADAVGTAADLEALEAADQGDDQREHGRLADPDQQRAPRQDRRDALGEVEEAEIEQ